MYDESLLSTSQNRGKKSQLYGNNSNNNLIWEDLDENDDEEEKNCSFASLNHAAIHNYLEEDLSLIERTAQRVKPIIEAICERLVKEKKLENLDDIDKNYEDQPTQDKNYERVNEITIKQVNKKINK